MSASGSPPCTAALEHMEQGSVAAAGASARARY